jgi:hypothetical protein
MESGEVPLLQTFPDIDRYQLVAKLRPNRRHEPRMEHPVPSGLCTQVLRHRDDDIHRSKSISLGGRNKPTDDLVQRSEGSLVTV